MIIKCPICETELSNDLKFTHENYEVFDEKWDEDCHDYDCSTAVRKGTWTIHHRYKPLSREESGRKEFEIDKTSMAIHIKDAKNLSLDKNSPGAAGCCHPDGLSSRNMRCINCNSLVATVEMDCWQIKQMLFELAENSDYLKLVPKNEYDYEFVYDPETDQDLPIYYFVRKFTHKDLNGDITKHNISKRSRKIDDQIVSVINKAPKKGMSVVFAGNDLFTVVKQGDNLLKDTDLETVRQYLNGLEDTFEIYEDVFWHSPASETHDIWGAYFDGNEYPSDQLLLDSFKVKNNIENRIIDFDGFISEDAYEWIKKDLAPFLWPGAFCTDEPLTVQQVQKITKILERRIELLETHDFETHRATGYWFNHSSFYHNYRPTIISLLKYLIHLLNSIVQKNGKVHINWI